MTSNDVPAPGAGTSGGRRRVLGRGPGAGAPRGEWPATPPEGSPAAELSAAPEAAPQQAPEHEAAVPEPIRETQPEAVSRKPVPTREVLASGQVSDPQTAGRASAPESAPETMPSVGVPGSEAVAAESVPVPDAAGRVPVPEPEAVGLGSGPASRAAVPERFAEEHGGAVAAESFAAAGTDAPEAGTEDAPGDGVFTVRLSNF